MKKLILLSLLCFTAYSQQPYVKAFILKYKTPQYATVLNGTSQYWSKASPNNLDLNGSEQLSNTTFDSDISGWSAFATKVKIIQNTNSLRVRSGAGSVAIIATDYNAGGGVSLSPQISNTTSNKYTFEAWVYAPSTDSTRRCYLNIKDQINADIYSQSAQTITANTWTKLVANFQLTGTQTTFMPTVRLSNAGINDTIYVDDVSLTQAYDAMIITNLNKTSTRAEEVVSYGLPHSSATTGYSLFVRNTNILTADISDGNVRPDAQSTTFQQSKYVSLAITFNRTGSSALYIDGVGASGTSLATLGKITSTSPLQIGWNTSIQYFTGYIGYVQIIKFSTLPSDIAQTIATITARKKPMNSYTNGTIVAWYDWRSGGRDLSGQGNHLTGTASPPIVRIP